MSYAIDFLIGSIAGASAWSFLIYRGYGMNIWDQLIPNRFEDDEDFGLSDSDFPDLTKF